MASFRPLEKALWLHKLCEHNYVKLRQLIPSIAEIGDTAVASVQGKPALHCRLIERSAHTVLVELTHDFNRDFARMAEPAVRIQVCLDAQVAEVIKDHCRPLVVNRFGAHADCRAVLDYKWNMNYFLSRWLDHCLANDYRFGLEFSARTECLADC